MSTDAGGARAGASRSVRVLGTAALLALGGLVAALVVVFAVGDESTSLATAALVPADAGLYVALNTDLASSQWIAAFVLTERLGQDDPEGRLRELAEEDGELDWEDDVAPLLGGDAAIYLRRASTPAELSPSDFAGAVILRVRDVERAIAIIREQTESETEERFRAGVPYYASVDGDLFLAALDEFVVLAPELEFLADVMDAFSGDLPALADEPDFQSAREGQPRDLLAFVYMDFAAFVGEGLETDEEDLRAALEEAGLADLLLQRLSASLRAEEDAFVAQSVMSGDPGPVAPSYVPRASAFADRVPAETLVFVSTSGLAEAWRLLREESGEAIDDLIAEGGVYENLDEALRAGGEALGLRSVEDVVRQLAGETAIAVWSPTARLEDIEAVASLEVASAAETRDILAAIAESVGADLRQTSVGGVTVTVWLAEDGSDVIAHAFEGETLLVGTPGGLTAVIDGFSQTLAGSERYRRGLDQVGPEIGSLVYVNVAGWLDFADELPDEVREAQSSLGGLLINTVQDGDSVRTRVALAVFE